MGIELSFLFLFFFTYTTYFTCWVPIVILTGDYVSIIRYRSLLIGFECMHALRASVVATQGKNGSSFFLTRIYFRSMLIYAQ